MFVEVSEDTLDADFSWERLDKVEVLKKALSATGNFDIDGDVEIEEDDSISFNY